MFIFIFLNLLDLTLTLIGLKLGLVEGNVLYSYLFSANLILGIIVKLLFTFIVAFLVHKKKPQLFKILNIIFSVVVVWNLGGIIWQQI